MLSPYASVVEKLHRDVNKERVTILKVERAGDVLADAVSWQQCYIYFLLRTFRCLLLFFASPLSTLNKVTAIYFAYPCVSSTTTKPPIDRKSALWFNIESIPLELGSRARLPSLADLCKYFAVIEMGDVEFAGGKYLLIVLNAIFFCNAHIFCVMSCRRRRLWKEERLQ